MSPVAEVTVVIPTLGASPYLREAVQSALAEQPADMIVVANGGAEVELDGVRIVRLEEADRSAARNLGVGQARTPLVAFLDDDDAALPGRLERQRAALEEAWWAPLAFGRVHVVDGDGHALEDWNRLLDARFSRLARTGAASYEDVLAVQAPIYTSATMVRRDAFLAVGGFDSAFDAYEDLDLYLRLARIGDLLPVGGDPVTTYRLHGSNTRSPRLYDGALRVAEKHLSGATGRGRRLLLERRVDALWGLERYDEARRDALRALVEEPSLLLHPRFARRLAGLALRR